MKLIYQVKIIELIFISLNKIFNIWSENRISIHMYKKKTNCLPIVSDLFSIL